MASATARRWHDIVIALASILGAVCIFLPFTYDTGPWGVVFDRGLWMVATPFFLSVPLLLASVWRLTSGTLTRPGRAVALAIGAAMSLVTLVGTYMLITENDLHTALEWTAVLIGPASTIVWVVLVLRQGRRDSTAIAALALPYIANAAFCLLCPGASARAASDNE